MRHTPAVRLVAVLTLGALVSACVTTQLPPISATGATFEPLPDELALWEEARSEEEQLLEKVTLYDDPLLVEYLEGVVGRLNPPGMADNSRIGYRVRIVEDPTLNAFAYPHGALYVHTGLLARMENESQIATVFGHEMTHVEHRHMLRFQRSARNKAIGLTVLSVAAAVAVAGEQADAYGAGDWSRGATIGVLSDLILGLGLQLAFLAAVNGYGRGLEHEADQGAFAKVVAAGYDPRESPKVYRALLDDHGEPAEVEGFFFGSHPRLGERIQNAEQLAAGATPPPDEAAKESEFDRRIRPVVRDDARLNLELGRLKLAESQLERALAWMPEDPETHLLVARLKLAKADAEKDPAAQEALRGEAEASLREAIRLDDGRPAPHRELGLLLYQAGDRRAACEAFRRYVRLAPEADDAARVRDYLLELERDGECG